MLQADARRLFASRDLDETRTLVGQVMKPHQLRSVSGRARVDARMHHVGLGEVSVSRLCYGADVEIDPGALTDFFLIMMPLRGGAQTQHGKDLVEAVQGQGTVACADQPLHMRWSADCDQLMVRIARPFMERMLSAQLGRPLSHPLRFAPQINLARSQAWSSVTRLLVDCAEQSLSTTTHGLMLGHVQELVASTLLAEQPHNHLAEAHTRRQAVLPRHVHRVQEHLQAHAHEPVTAAELAAVAGVSLRGLYAGFKDFCGVSPMQYLRDLRLDRARADLLSAGTGVSVAGVAMRWGFGHLGRFSADYKARHGESPSETLRKR